MRFNRAYIPARVQRMMAPESRRNSAHSLPTRRGVVDLPATALDRFEVWAAVEPGGLWELPGQPDYIERPAMALDVVRALRQAGDYASIQVVRLNRYGGVDRVVFDIQRGPDGIWKRTNFPLAPYQPVTEVGSSQNRG